MHIVISNTIYFKALIRSLLNYTNFADFTFKTNKTINIRHLSSQNTILIDSKLSNLDSFELDEDISGKINLQLLHDILSDNVILQYENSHLIVKINNSQYTLPMTSIDSISLKEFTTIEFDYRICIDSKLYNHICNLIKKEEFVNIICNSSSLTFKTNSLSQEYANCDTCNIVANIKNTDKATTSIETRDIIKLVNNKYYSDTVELHLKNNSALAIKMHFGTIGYTTYGFSSVYVA